MRKGFTPEWQRWMTERSIAIVKATQRKGMPMTYGTGKPPEGKKK